MFSIKFNNVFAVIFINKLLAILNFIQDVFLIKTRQ